MHLCFLMGEMHPWHHGAVLAAPPWLLLLLLWFLPRCLISSHPAGDEAQAGQSPSPSYLSIQRLAKQTGNNQCRGEAVWIWKPSQRKRALQLSTVLFTQSPLCRRKDLL